MKISIVKSYDKTTMRINLIPNVPVSVYGKEYPANTEEIVLEWQADKPIVIHHRSENRLYGVLFRFDTIRAFPRIQILNVYTGEQLLLIPGNETYEAEATILK
ncbi:MAG: hypothetical protein FWC79_02305 [Oscillospiraceae bacterium]|nr:hypothetical protein [Oscillospiraceae bacterium]